MKKFFTLCACIAAVITTNAQEFTPTAVFHEPTYPLYKQFIKEPLIIRYQPNFDGTYNDGRILLYDYDFNLIKEFDFIEAGSIYHLTYTNYDSPYINNQCIMFTQTLFNNDDKFEFIHIEYYTDEKEYIHSTPSLRSEDGTVLHTFPTDTHINGIKAINGNYYIDVRERYEVDNQSNFLFCFYLIDKQATSTIIKKVAKIKGPRISITNGSVKIELQNESNGNSKVVITNINGQVIKLVKIPTGVKDIDIDTSGMQCGIHNFTIIEGDKILESGKIAVK